MQLRAAFLVFLLSIFLMLPSAIAASSRSVDARALDIAGVKTGMDWDEALAAAAKHFNVPPSAIYVDKHPNENIITGQRLPVFFNYDKDGIKFSVSFLARVPHDKARPMVVSQINYELPWSQENAVAMKEAAVAKYGTPSNAPHDKTSSQWCAKADLRRGSSACDHGQAVLKLFNTQMELVDPAWKEAEIKFRRDSQTRKPSF